MAELSVQLLGPVRAARADVTLDLGSAHRRAVFAVLAIQPDRVVSREEIISAVWGEDAPQTVSGSLYTYVSGLRRVLEPTRTKWAAAQVLVSAGSGYSLRLDPGLLDVTRFTELRAEAQRHRAGNDLTGALTAMDSALALWNGEALSGITGQFAELQRGRLGELRLATLEQRAEVVLASGGHHEAVTLLSDLVREHPLREVLRGHLMLALHRAGRRTEALDVFNQAHATMVEQLGIEPGPGLQRLHEQVLADDPSLRYRPLGIRAGQPEPVLGEVVGQKRPAPESPENFFGRETELATLWDRVEDVRAGQGATVWLEGEPGIGKSKLLEAGFSGADGHGCQVLSGAGDELGQRFPLALISRCLGIEAHSHDPRRAKLATALRADTPPRLGWMSGDPVLAAVEQILEFVGELCAESPLVLVVDDLQWADKASLLVWHRLAKATRRLPLLLVGSCRQGPRRAELEQLRNAVTLGGDELIALGPLDDLGTAALITGLLGATPGNTLLDLADSAAGNPLYLRQLIDALLRSDVLDIEEGVAEVPDADVACFRSDLMSSVRDKLVFLSKPTTEVLRWATLLGVEFDLHDLSTIMGRPASDLLAAIEEAAAFGVLQDTGHRFAFQHPLVRDAHYDTTPAAVRLALHRQAAEALEKAGAPAERVAEQLLAAPISVDAWVTGWVLANTDAVAEQAPATAVELIDRVVAAELVSDEHREVLTARLARLRFCLGMQPDHEARTVLLLTDDPSLAAEMRLILAYLHYSRGDIEAAIETLRAAVRDPLTPDRWRARHQSLQAMIERCGLDDMDAARNTARHALARAHYSGDLFAVAHALQDLWQVESAGRQHLMALHYVDRALETVRGQSDLTDVHLSLLDNKIFTQQNLDRLTDANRTLATAQDVVTRHTLPAGLHIPAAVHYYWLGRWDDAITELEAVAQDGPEVTFYGLHQRGAGLLLHGAAALIAAHRGATADLEAHLAAAGNYPVSAQTDREHSDFLLAAKAIAVEQRGKPEKALQILMPALERKYAQMMLRHQWLPTMMRLALETGNQDVAQQIMAAAEEEAALEDEPARAANAAAWCCGLMTGEPQLLRHTAEHFDRIGRRTELAAVREDLAWSLAVAGQAEEAKTAFNQAMVTYTALGASWDVRRAEQRLKPFGIRRASSVVDAERLGQQHQRNTVHTQVLRVLSRLEWDSLPRNDRPEELSS